MNPLQECILQYLEQYPDTSFTVSELARRLKIKLADKRKLRVTLKALAKGGQLVSSERGRSFAYSVHDREETSTRIRIQEMAEKTLLECMDGIIEEFQLPTAFPKKVIAESEVIAEKIPEKEIQNRRDLRSQMTVTIDGENAKDFDDAIAVEDIGRDQIRLRVSIADVSHYIIPGSTIDKEAYARGTSVYFPDRVIPMLPERLSNNICSLVPHKDRLCITAEIDFDKEGHILRTDFYKSIIRNGYRLTYTQVAKALIDRDEDVRHELRHILSHLELMEKLYLRLRHNRIARGSLDFDLPEPLIIMEMEEGRVDAIVKSERTRAHMMIEEFMIAANEAVARFITEQDVPMVYRIHEAPTREKLEDLQLKLHNLGYALKVPKKKIEPRILADITRKAQGKPESRMINTLLLRSLAKAIYSADSSGHFGLASSCYTHFTSPIRRYPDLMVHRILSSLLECDKTSNDGASLLRRSSRSGCEGRARAPMIDLRRLKRMSEQCSLRERLAMQAEWAVRDLMQVTFMKEHVGKNFAGIISDVTRFGIFVELTKYFVAGLIHMRNLTDDYYHFIEASHSLAGKRTKKRFRIGDSIWIRVIGTDIEKRWIDFESIEAPSSEMADDANKKIP